MTKKLLLLVPIALGASALISVPASAANANSARSIQTELRQIDRQIDNTRGLSQREENRLENRIDGLRSLYRSYSRGGLNRGEVIRLNREISSLKADIRSQARDRDRRRH